MITMLQNWKGAVEVDGKQYDTITSVPQTIFTVGKPFSIRLLTNTRPEQKTVDNRVVTPEKKEIRITVKKYMTEPSSPGFDFMAKWNNNVPMPLRTMTGIVLKETRGMVQMELHGVGEPVVKCMRCGRVLTNPVSRHYGIGPECMSKLGIVADINDIDAIKEKLVDITWTGWVIKSAIIEEEEV